MGKYLKTLSDIKKMGKHQDILWSFSPRTLLLFTTFGIVVLLMSFQMIHISQPDIYHTPNKSDCKPPRELEIPNMDILKREIINLTKNAHAKLEQDIMMSFIKWNSLYGEKSKSKQFWMLPQYRYQVPHETNLTGEYWNRNWKDVLPLDYQVYMYLENFEKTCENYDSWNMVSTRRDVPQNTASTLCPCVPGTLRGHSRPDKNYLKSTTWNMTSSLARTMAFGGYWKPQDCLARRRVAVIIPCRDREMHLRAFLVHTHPLLQRQLLEYRIFVVEQNWPMVFNKASTMNAGFLEATKLFKFDCVVFHDVDLLSEDDRSIIHCGKAPVHYGAHLDVWNYTVFYEQLFGGAISMTVEQFIKINGFSNEYFGWGGEDDNMALRVHGAGYDVFRPPSYISKHTALQHRRDISNPVNRESGSTWKNLNFSEGLTTVEYATDDIYLEPMYTLIKINLKVKDLSRKTFREQKDQSYIRVSGGCHNPSILYELSLSLVSCRYYCHMLPDCKAFLYYERNEIHCVHLNAICSIKYGMPDVTVYIKDANDDRYLLHFNKTIHYREVPGTCHKNDLIPRGLNGTLNDCMVACSNARKCQGFVYADSPIQPCWLKKKLCGGSIQPVMGVVYYIKFKRLQPVEIPHI